MVYYGKLSKGCQRCRQRKVKCDQARPTCQRCERSGLNCPGYRNLNAIIFRDETKRIIGQVSRQQGWHSTSNDDCLRSGASSNPVSSLTSPFMARSAISSPIPLHDIPSRPLSQCIQDLAVNFFFNKYTYSEPQFFSDYRDWLSECYQDQVNDVLRAALEAVGLAGLSNVSAGAEVLARQSRKKYCRALVCMRDTLNDPIRAVADTTLMTVMLLILFETVNFDTWDQYRCWEAHVRAATALLELRGQEQFNREGGALLYIQLRSEILFNCIQHHEYVHPALVQATYIFQTSPIRHQWRSRGVASPGSICEIAFRIVNLYADFEGSDVRSVEPITMYDRALQIEADLESWKAVAPQVWTCTIVDNSSDGLGPECCSVIYNGRRHKYPSPSVAVLWNHWRVLSILVHQLLIRIIIALGAFSSVGAVQDGNHKRVYCARRIRQLSDEVCTSVRSFVNTSRLPSLIWPLYIVALDDVNPDSMRSFAMQQLRLIAASTGIRQASLLAQSAKDGKVWKEILGGADGGPISYHYNDECQHRATN